MAVYTSLPPDVPPLPLISTNSQVPADLETLKKDILLISAYLNNLITYLATYTPSVEVP